MIERVKDYFHFSKGERLGIIMLCLFILLVILGKESLIYFNPEPTKESSRYDSLILMLEQKAQVEKNNAKIDDKEEVKLTPFNPNSLSKKEWQELGLSEKQSEVIKKYQRKSGGFRSKRDVKKMFVISDELYTKLAPYIQLPDTSPLKQFLNAEKKEWKYKPRVLKKVKMNSADTLDYDSLYGIGKVLAKRIIKYREKLGGFISKDQLREVYGLSEELLEKLDTQLILLPKEIIKLNINSLNTEKLKSHPYISWNVANSIVKYREQHGNYARVEDIKKLKLVSDSLYKRIVNYIEI